MIELIKRGDQFEICQQCLNYYEMPICQCQSKGIDQKKFDDVLEQVREWLKELTIPRN
ncbi:hypothetical protein KAR91_35660 [Candidatus Pacearchaeota archaeon]|nr:hypothetical protein [Candidatus Pacearchaeota archaeon]